MAKPDLTLESALEIVLCMESAAKKAREMKGQKNGVVLKVSKQVPSGTGSSSAPTKICGRCGHGKHSRDQCKFKEATCHKCKKVRHISPMCWSKPKASSKQSTKWLCADSTSSTDEPLYCITDHSSCPP